MTIFLAPSAATCRAMIGTVSPPSLRWPPVIATPPQDTFADRDRDLVRIERALPREQPVLLLVFLSDHHRLVRRAVQLLAHLHFDQRALLLDHDDEIEALCEFLQLAARKRPGARDLVELDAEIV